MRCLFPTRQDEVDVAQLYGHLQRHVNGRPSVRLNMISSVDGAAALAGRSGTLGGIADKDLFAILRGQADVILVGAGTMRVEEYGPVELDEPTRARRRAAGMAAVPPIAVMTRSCRLAWDTSFSPRPRVVRSSLPG